MKFSSTNNFDLIRVFAATQVAVLHAAENLDYQNWWLSWLGLFPGVPIFFFVSGFLIYGSFESSLKGDKPLYNFYVKRFLRLYPALWLCILFSGALIWFSGYLATTDYEAYEVGVWVFTSSTFFQFYNPDFLRGFGVGAINGSLWTIAVELQFYLLTPLVYFVLKKAKFIIIITLILFCIINTLHVQYNQQETIIEKLFAVSFAPWFYMFMLGAIAYKQKHYLHLIQKTPLTVIFLLFLVAWQLSSSLGLNWGNSINVVGFLILIILTLKFAITKPHISDNLLQRNDISYGIYIFHMPIVNLLIFTNITGLKGWLISLAATFAIALFSWFLVEKPLLGLKKRQLRRS